MWLEMVNWFFNFKVIDTGSEAVKYKNIKNIKKIQIVQTLAKYYNLQFALLKKPFIFFKVDKLITDIYRQT